MFLYRISHRYSPILFLPEKSLITIVIDSLLKILKVGYYGKDDNPLYPLFNQIYSSSGNATNIVDQLKKAIISAQEKAGDWHSINSRWLP